MTGYLPIGFEFASELTYPEPEGTSSGLLNMSAQVFGIIFMSVASTLDAVFGDVVSNLSMGGFMLIGTILTGELLVRFRSIHQRIAGYHSWNMMPMPINPKLKRDSVPAVCKSDLRRQRAFAALLDPITPSTVVTAS